ncbi:MAG: SAM-dependent methyltransferase [Woeseiaceae bacterium]|nr:SAM-dependent methyltransferase [Woeseiaceae bacterium]
MTDIHIVGLGVSSIHQITREAEQAISVSNEVLYLDTGAATRRYLEERCERVTALHESSYEEGDHRLNAYHHMAAKVVDAAMSHAPVTFAVHGHPLVAVYAPFLIMDMAKVLGLIVSVAPGVSAFDSIVAELGIDPSIEGLQMYEATDLLLRRRPLQPDVPALIWQIGNLESRLHTMRVSRPERFERFFSYLGQFYAEDHPVIAIYTSPHPLMPAQVLRFPLGELPEHAAAIHAGFSLYVPASVHRPIHDLDLLADIDSPAHLDAITR